MNTKKHMTTTEVKTSNRAGTPAVAVKRVVSLILSWEQSEELCAELWNHFQSGKMSRTLQDVYNRIGTAKANASLNPKCVGNSKNDPRVIAFMLKELPANDWNTMSEENRNHWRKRNRSRLTPGAKARRSDPVSFSY